MVSEERKARMREYNKTHRSVLNSAKARWLSKPGNEDKARRSKREWARNHLCNYLDTDHYKWEDVEGYDGFTTNICVHHKREAIGYTPKQLKEQGQYYGCRADELLCCTRAEHKRIHAEIDKFFHRGNYKD